MRIIPLALKISEEKKLLTENFMKLTQIKIIYDAVSSKRNTKPSIYSNVNV